jgi:hypothetical protein
MIRNHGVPVDAAELIAVVLPVACPILTCGALKVIGDLWGQPLVVFCRRLKISPMDDGDGRETAPRGWSW